MIAGAVASMLFKAYFLLGASLAAVLLAILLGVWSDRRAYKKRGGKRLRDITTMKRKK